MWMVKVSWNNLVCVNLKISWKESMRFYANVEKSSENNLMKGIYLRQCVSETLV